jgi:hypothetical protein
MFVVVRESIPTGARTLAWLIALEAGIHATNTAVRVVAPNDSGAVDRGDGEGEICVVFSFRGLSWNGCPVVEKARLGSARPRGDRGKNSTARRGEDGLLPGRAAE